MNCTACQELLNRQADGELLVQDTLTMLSGHLAECPSCRQLQQELTALLATAHSLQELSYERSVVLAPLVLRPSSLRPFLAGVMVAASVAVVFGMGLMMGGEQGVKPQASAELQVVRLVVPMAGAERVEVVGDFTGWQKRMALSPAADGVWVGEVKVPPGRYKYMIVVDDAALQPDPAARELVDDGFGGKNSVLDVGSI